MKKPKLGSGMRFSRLEKSIASSGKSASSAKAIAASIGIKKYGKTKMARLAAAGRMRKG